MNSPEAWALSPEACLMIRTEIQIRLPNSPGSLARVAALLAAEKVRILALSLESGGTARLVVDNVERAAHALAQEHLRVEKRDVLFTRVSARSLGSLLTAAADAGVNLEYLYASSAEGSPDANGVMAVVLGVDDAMSASVAAGI